MYSVVYRVGLIGFSTMVLLLGAPPVQSQIVDADVEYDSPIVQAIPVDPNDDPNVTLCGKLAEEVGEEKYLFEDETGGNWVEIEEEVADSFHQSPETGVGTPSGRQARRLAASFVGQ